MGLRTKLKGRVKRLLGSEVREPERAPPPPMPAQPKSRPTPPIAAAPKAEVSPAPPTKAPKAAKATPSSEGEPAPKKIDPEKIARARARARKGVLSFVQDKGGTSSIGEMHDHSERRYFIAHKAFSDLMEDMIRDEVIQWDSEGGIATLTQWGEKELAGQN